MTWKIPWFFCVLVTCASAQEPSATAGAADPWSEANERAAAERYLRKLFPGFTGELDAAGIAAWVDASRARDTEARGGSGSGASGGIRAATHAALERGDYELARSLLSELLAEAELVRARGMIAAGRMREALATLDRAHDLAPQSSEVLTLRGEAALAVGTEDREPALIESALEDFVLAARRGSSARGWLGASLAARALSRGEEALEFARRGVAAITERDRPTAFAISPRRIHAQACLDAYRARHPEPALNPPSASVGPPSASRALFDECRGALEHALGETPDDAWAWSELAWLYEWDGDTDQSRAVARRGLTLAPDDARLHAGLARVLQRVGGSKLLLATYAEILALYPDVALAEWYPAVSRFDDAVKKFAAKQDAVAEFRAAERGFTRCRELDPQHDAACRAYEVLCRSGAGWSLLEPAERADLEAAQRAFLSMEDVIAGGLAWELKGSLPSGVQGLHVIGAAWAKRGDDPDSLEYIENVERAAKIYDFLHSYQPLEVTWANNAGFFNRDTAVALERKARISQRRGKIDEANRLLQRAREMMEQSYRDYVAAAELAPEDVRIANDTGLILTYYLQRDDAEAERYLLEAVRLGEAQLPDLARRAQAEGLPARDHELALSAKENVEIALGDAYQNLGVLYLTLRGDAATALTWFEKCLRTGPDPRQEVQGEGGYLDQCKSALAGKSNPQVTDAMRWLAPATTMRAP